MKARIRGVMSVMKTFEFVFCCCLGQCLLSHTDNLSKALQRQDISAAEAQMLSAQVIEVLCKNKIDDIYDLFWSRVLKWKEELKASAPILQRKKKLQNTYIPHFL